MNDGKITFTFCNSVTAASLFTDHGQHIKLPPRKGSETRWSINYQETKFERKS